MILHYIKTIYESFSYNRFRTFLTGLGILIGISSLVIILTVSNSFEKKLISELSSNNSISIGLSCSNVVSGDLEGVVNLSEVKESIYKASLINGVKELVQDKGTDLLSYIHNGKLQSDVEYEFNNEVSITKGEGFYKNIGNVVVIRNSDEYDNEIQINDNIIINGISYKVIGYTNEYEENSFPILYFPEKLSTEIRASKYEETSTFELYINDKYSSKEVVNNVLNILNEKVPTGYKFINYSEDMNSSIGLAINSISMFITLIAGISLIVATINVANIMYISILERKDEIAIYRALGMKKNEVRLLFLIESIIIVIIFSGIGYLFGIFIAYIIITVLRIKMIININDVLLTILLSILVGVISGYRPAKIASESNTSDILR